MRYKAIRVVRKVGNAHYLVLPLLARRELRIFDGDWIELELDTDTKELTLRTVHAREEIPLIRFKSPDMVPASATPLPPAPPRAKPAPELPLEEVAS